MITGITWVFGLMPNTAALSFTYEFLVLKKKSKAKKSMLMGHVLHMDFKNRIEWHDGVGFKRWAGFNNTIANTLAFILKDVNVECYTKQNAGSFNVTLIKRLWAISCSWTGCKSKARAANIRSTFLFKAACKRMLGQSSVNPLSFMKSRV